MTDFPSSVYEPRTMENRPGVEYDEAKTKVIFAEDFNNDRDEIVAIETYIGAFGASLFAGRDQKASPAGNDRFGYNDSADSWKLKYINWTSIVLALEAYFDTIYEDILGYTPEDEDNKETGDAPTDNTAKYPSSHTVLTHVADKVPAQYFVGQLGSQTSGQKTITEIDSEGIDLVTSNQRLLPDKAGWYYVSAKQLVTTGAGALYMQTKKNSTVVVVAYLNAGLSTFELKSDFLVYLNGTTDYVTFYFDGTASTVWTGTHSSVVMFRVA